MLTFANGRLRPCEECLCQAVDRFPSYPREYAGIGREREGRRGVSQERRNLLDRGPAPQRERGEGVPRVVQTEARDADSPHDAGELLAERVGSPGRSFFAKQQVF